MKSKLNGEGVGWRQHIPDTRVFLSPNAKVSCRFSHQNTSSGHLWVARSTSPRSAKTATWTKALAHITCGLGGAHGPSWSSWPSSSHQLGGDGHLLWQVWSPDRAAIWCMLLKCLVYLCSWWGWTMSNTLEPNQPKPLHLTLSVLSWSLSEMYKICEEIYPWILVICRTDSCATLGSPPRWPPFPELDGVDIPSGNLTVCYWKWWFIVDFPIEKRWFSIVMLDYQRVTIMFQPRQRLKLWRLV